jgi:outer membrane protein assembly factor BamB
MTLVRGRSSAAWARRAALAVVLAGAAIIPGRAASVISAGCQGRACGSAGKVLWSRLLPGSWAASPQDGTVPAQGQAYLAAGGGVAAVGSGLLVTAYDLTTGEQRWQVPLTGLPAGAAVVSVRAWPGVVTVGVLTPRTRRHPAGRTEVVLGDRTGGVVRRYPAAVYGGAVAASADGTVVIGPRAVTSYANATGRVRWRRATGPRPQAWRLDGGDLYLAVTDAGYLAGGPVSALRRISLRTGSERVLRPSGREFAGTLSAALDGVLLFTGPGGVSAYSGLTGQLLWQRASVLPQSADVVSALFYLSRGNTLMAVQPGTGMRVRGRTVTGSAGLYGVRDGVALGLDHGAEGDAWGYRVAGSRVIWTTPQIPWPHFFTDLSGVGGSADPGSAVVLLTACASVGSSPSPATGPGGPSSGSPSASPRDSSSPESPAPSGTPGAPGGGVASPVCLRPELVAIHR